MCGGEKWVVSGALLKRMGMDGRRGLFTGRCRIVCLRTFLLVLLHGIEGGTVVAGRDGLGAEASFDPYHSNVEAGL